jgi:hypothetical protein
VYRFDPQDPPPDKPLECPLCGAHVVRMDPVTEDGASSDFWDRVHRTHTTVQDGPHPVGWDLAPCRCRVPAKQWTYVWWTVAATEEEPAHGVSAFMPDH